MVPGGKNRVFKRARKGEISMSIVRAKDGTKPLEVSVPRFCKVFKPSFGLKTSNVSKLVAPNEPDFFPQVFVEKHEVERRLDFYHLSRIYLNNASLIQRTSLRMTDKLHRGCMTLTFFCMSPPKRTLWQSGCDASINGRSRIAEKSKDLFYGKWKRNHNWKFK